MKFGVRHESIIYPENWTKKEGRKTSENMIKMRCKNNNLQEVINVQ